MFFISLFILFFAVVFAFDRFIFRDFSEQFDTITQLFRLYRTSNELRDMRISSLEKRLDEFEKKFGKITVNHHGRIKNLEENSFENISMEIWKICISNENSENFFKK